MSPVDVSPRAPEAVQSCREDGAVSEHRVHFAGAQTTCRGRFKWEVAVVRLWDRRDASLGRTPNASTVWVTELHVDTLKQFTAMRIGAQGGLNTTARYCVYMAEVDSDALTQLLSAIYVPESGRIVIVHTATGALLGANFPFNSLVNDSGVLRPRLFTEVRDAAPLMSDVVRQFKGSILNCSSSCELDAGVSFDKLFVRVRHLDTQDYGLNVRVVIAMKAIDFLRDIQDTRVYRRESWSLSVTLPALAQEDD